MLRSRFIACALAGHLGLSLLLAPDAVAAPVAHARPSWSYETLGAVWARPLIGADGRIYVGSEDGFFYCFAPGGRLLWTYKASHGFGGWPIFWQRDTLAVGNRNGKLYLFSRDGELRGTVVLGGPASGPPALLGKRLLVPTASGNLVAVEGKQLLWSHPLGSPISGWPVAARGGARVYAGGDDGAVIALDPTGRRLWRAALGSPVANGLVPLADGVLAATRAGDVVSLDGKGEVRWRQRLEPTESGLAALAGQLSLLGGLSGRLLALDDRGQVRWRFEADAPIRSLPTVAGERILFGTDQGSLFILQREGRPLGLLQAAGAIRGGIAVAGGQVLFGGQDRRFYVLPDPGRTLPAARFAWRAPLQRSPRGQLLWRRDLSGPVARGVAPGSRGGLLAATHGKRLFSMGAAGEVRWSYSCGDDIDTLPAAGPGGEIFFGCGDGGFYGLKPDGELRYRYPVNKALSSSPAVARDGTVYFGAADRRLYALNAAGKAIWRILTGDEIEAAPLIAPDGMVYVGSDDRHLYAVSPLGQVSWYYRTDGAVRSRPALGKDGTLYLTSFDQQLHAVSNEGSGRWTYQTDGQIVSSPALGPDGTVYFGSQDHHLYAVTPDGKLRWRFTTGGEVDSDPVLTAAGDIAVGSDDGNLYVLSPSGELRWWFPAGAEIRGTLLARPDGSLVVGTMAGAVLALAPPGTSRSNLTPGVEARLPLGRGRVGPALALSDGGLLIAGADGVLRGVGVDGWPSFSVAVATTALSQPVVDSTGAIYVSDGQGNLAAAAAGAGSLRFRLRLDRRQLSAPALLPVPGEPPLVLVGSASGRVWAVTAEAKVRWFHSGAFPVSAAPLVFARDRVAVAATPELGILSAQGERVASVRLPGGLRSGPVAVGQLALCGDGHGRLLAFDRNGARRWQRDLGSGILDLRALADGSSVAVATDDGRAFRVSAEGELLLTASGSAPYLMAGSDLDPLDLLLVQADQSLWRLAGASGRRSRVVELSDATVALLRTRSPAVKLVVITRDGQLTWVAPAAPGSRE